MSRLPAVATVAAVAAVAGRQAQPGAGRCGIQDGWGNGPCGGMMRR